MAKLSFYHGVMGAGKSEELMKIYRNYTRINKEPVVFSYSADNRFGDDFGVVGLTAFFAAALFFRVELFFVFAAVVVFFSSRTISALGGESFWDSQGLFPKSP